MKVSTVRQDLMSDGSKLQVRGAATENARRASSLRVPGTEWRRNVAENFNRLSRAHKRYIETDEYGRVGQTDGRQHSERYT